MARNSDHQLRCCFRWPADCLRIVGARRTEAPSAPINESIGYQAENQRNEQSHQWRRFAVLSLHNKFQVSDAAYSPCHIIRCRKRTPRVRGVSSGEPLFCIRKSRQIHFKPCGLIRKGMRSQTALQPEVAAVCDGRVFP
jgi:hypothetical protein